MPNHSNSSLPPQTDDAPHIPDPAEQFRDRLQSLLSRRLAKGQTISTDDARAVLATALSFVSSTSPPAYPVYSTHLPSSETLT